MKDIKVITLFSLVVFTSFCAFFFTRLLGEYFFFDRLFLGKSLEFGYVSAPGELLEQDRKIPQPIKRRVNDLKDAVENESTESPAQGRDTYTVGLIGDSFVFGTGVKANQTIGAFLEKKLNIARPSNVISLALPGDSYLDNYAKLELADKHFHPDAYIMVIVRNDFYFDQVDRYPNEKQIFDRVREHCPGSIHLFQYQNYKTEDEVLLQAEYPSILESNANLCLMSKMIDEVAQKFPNLFYLSISEIKNEDQLSASDSEAWKKEMEIMRVYRALIEKNNALLINPANIPNFKYERVSPGEGHSSAKTNELYAEALFHELTTNPKWGFAPAKWISPLLGASTQFNLITSAHLLFGRLQRRWSKTERVPLVVHQSTLLLG